MHFVKRQSIKFNCYRNCHSLIENIDKNALTNVKKKKYVLFKKIFEHYLF